MNVKDEESLKIILNIKEDLHESNEDQGLNYKHEGDFLVLININSSLEDIYFTFRHTG